MVIELGANVIGNGYNPNENKFIYQLNLKNKINLNIFDLRDYKNFTN